VADNAIAGVVKNATGMTVARKLRDWTEDTRDPDCASLLAPFGVHVERRAALDSLPFALLGIKLAGDKIAEVHDGSPAQVAAISAGDTLVAIEGLRATGATIDRLLARHAPGETVEVAVFRRDELMRFAVTLAARPPERYVVQIDPAADAAARRRRQSWLG